MKTLYNSLLILLSFVALVSCTKEGLDVSFGPGNYSFTGRGGIISIPINVPTDWNVSSDKGWITFEQNHGDASSQCINVICDVNRTFSKRYATITLRSGISKKTLKLEQEVGSTYIASYYKLDPSSLEANGLTPVLYGDQWGFNLYEHIGPLETIIGGEHWLDRSTVQMIDIPSTVKTINGPFVYEMNVIVCRAKIAPTLINGPFVRDYSYYTGETTHLTIYVPEGSDYSSWENEYFHNRDVTFLTLKDPTDINFDYVYQGVGNL